MKDLTELLNYIPASQLDYQEWVNVGMALKHEGYSCDIWDAWSASDSRHKAGECQKKWNSFKEGAGKIVTGGTIHELASRFGYQPSKSREIVTFDWDDVIEYDGEDRTIKDAAWVDAPVIEAPKDDAFSPTDELRRFIQALFKPSEIVGFCIDAEYDEDKKKWKPSSRGAYGMTAKQILDSIKKHPQEIEAIIGDYNKAAGAWIRFNPLDGEGVGNTNVTDLRYALVESDNLEIEKQKALMEELQLPIAMMTYSGGKSVHAIVRVDAISPQDYREKVDYLYRVCEKNGLIIDKQNKNASRMTRMPGVIRGEKKQFIISEKSGFATFDEWKEYIEDSIDTLPEILNFASLETLPELSPELIEGILRKGHKMLIAGPSKAGKSFLLIELALAITSGRSWLGFECAKGKVLYINLEVDDRSFIHRVNDVRIEMGLKKKPTGLDIWNLRGERTDINTLAPRLIRRAKNKGYDAIIFDPLYKINEGDENSASEMGRFFNQLDHICATLHTSIICCHHHSKGAQGAKFSMDRASGSGVFARDPDALLDMIQLNPADAEVSLEDGQTAWRIACTLREFQTPDDIDVIFSFPVHKVTTELRDALPISGQDARTNSKRGNATKTSNAEKKYERLLTFFDNWEAIDPKEEHTPNPTVKEAAEYFKSDRGYSPKSIKRWIEDHDELTVINGVIFSANDGQTSK